MRPRRPSIPTAIAFVALFAALTSPAWAASASKLIKGKQIAKNSITSAKVKDGSLLAKDFKKGELTTGASPGSTGAGGESGAKGPKGDKGEKGDKGDTGAQGVPGPSVTGAAQSGNGNASGTIAAGGTTVIDLNSGATTTGQIVLPFAGRILAQGVADVANTAAATSRTRCNLYVSDGTGPTNGLTVFSPNSFADLPAVDNQHGTLPVVGSVTKPAGTYNVVLQCGSITGTVSGYSASITVVAVPTA